MSEPISPDVLKKTITSGADNSDNTSLKEGKPSGGNNNKVSFISKLFKGFSNVKGEFKKVVWPNRATLVKKTITVIITSLLVGSIIVILDFIYSTAFVSFVDLLR